MVTMGTMVTGNKKTGEIKIYDLEQLFSFDAMKRTMAYIASPDECEELRKYFGVTDEGMGRNEAGDEEDSHETSDEEKIVKRMECLLNIIGERGFLDAYNINHLKDALAAISHGKHVSYLQGPIEGYVHHSLSKVSKEDLLAEMTARQKAWEDERNHLTSTVTTAEMEINKYEKTVEAKEGELQKLTKELAVSTKEKEKLTKELNQTKQTLDMSRGEIEVMKDELEQSRTDSTRKIETLIEELEQTTTDFARESKALQKGPVVEKPLDHSEEIRDGDMASLAAEFGRLTVAIAEHLTLDQCLKLARLFNVPESECDMVRRLSLVEYPGMKFLDLLKKRQVINIFDVSNLQKGLAMLHLEIVNHDLVVPYQEKIDDEQYELNKAEEMYSWEEVNAFLNAVKNDAGKHQIRESQTSLQDDSVPGGKTSQLGAKGSWSEARVEDSQSHLADKHHLNLYTERSIGIEGGTIEVSNVFLSIPSGALSESHVIALSVMNDSPFLLDKEVDTARVTPLIKLEPPGLTFKKVLQLNIPHSALITEPESHDVIIYSGKTFKNNEDASDSVTWTEERSVPRELKEKSLTVDIQCLSYLSVSLVSQTSAPALYIVRAVLFVDGVRNTNDDITLTVCFCGDNESEYDMLLADYKTKLPLEQYSTLQLYRHSESDKDNAGFLSLTVTSVNNTYAPDTEHGVKRFAVSHLCTTSRVSHQLRLKKNQDTKRDVVDIKLTFSQAQYEPTRISLTARVKDLIISEESDKLLSGPIVQGNKRYENLLFNISSRLGTEQCRELATYFQFTLEDTEMITSNQDPGKMLMKTLEERSVINAEKMVLFFEGLKVCHLDETAELVSEYISEISKQNQEEKQRPGEDTKFGKLQEETSHISKDRPDVVQTVVTGLGKKFAEQLLFDIADVLFYIVQAAVQTSL